MAQKGGLIVNRSQLAATFGVSLPTVDQWVRSGCPHVTKGAQGQSWKFNTADVTQWRISTAVAEATGDADALENDLRRRRMLADTKHAELNLAKAQGEVAPLSEFEREWARAFTTVQVNVMNVPQRAVVRLLGCTDEAEFKEVLAEELRLALEQSAEEDVPEEDAGEDLAA